MIKNIWQSTLLFSCLFFFLCVSHSIHAMNSPLGGGSPLQHVHVTPPNMSQLFQQPIQYVPQPIYVNGVGGNHASTDFGFLAPFASFLGTHPLLAASAIFTVTLWQSENFRGIVHGWVFGIVSESLYNKFMENTWRKLWKTDQKSVYKEEGAQEQKRKHLEKSLLDAKQKEANLESQHKKDLDQLEEKYQTKKAKHKEKLESVEKLRKKQVEELKEMLKKHSEQIETLTKENARLEQERTLKSQEGCIEREKQIKEFAELQVLNKLLQEKLNKCKNKIETYKKQRIFIPTVQQAYEGPAITNGPSVGPSGFNPFTFPLNSAHAPHNSSFQIPGVPLNFHTNNFFPRNKNVLPYSQKTSEINDVMENIPDDIGMPSPFNFDSKTLALPGSPRQPAGPNDN